MGEQPCSEKIVRMERAGGTYLITTEKGAKAFIPIDKVCELVKRFGLCLPENSPVKCK